MTRKGTRMSQTIRATHESQLGRVSHVTSRPRSHNYIIMTHKMMTNKVSEGLYKEESFSRLMVSAPSFSSLHTRDLISIILL